ncbi:L-aspartate oxidase [Porphyromonas sp.]|uniref:L-aspartate oxidase n=1 Tax=Porphyromonas sp. TaxID=1924944 RepID=UPI0026DCB021|nr:L-aspartate oxidase [Porphyromonas sp.]MDO4695197.1 L-aspartate oxidase [Porphyromonas sp.]MDO4771003.1 L-aspartate oxidase [Porphyromonas sp.]
MRMYDFIVVGGGLAGLYTALFLAKKGKVALVSNRSMEESNSYMAQGGMAAVMTDEDSPALHFRDTMEAGRGLCDSEAVKILTEEAPERIRELIDLGMLFDMESGHLALALEGGHHRKRILHAGGDATGRMLTSFMIEQVKSNDLIDLFLNHHVLKLLVDNDRVYGIISYDIESEEIEACLSGTVILATGGAAALYTPTTNPLQSTGDGIAMAYEAGADIMDMEFVQFHPTAFYSAASESSFLISEAVRGEGAHLLDARGGRFMVGIHPLEELAPRDVVAREIFKVLEREHSTHVILSLKHLDPEYILHRFPSIAKHCRKFGYDLGDQIPVAPAAHYTVGGIKVELNGQTSLKGLYAVGEVSSTGVMGANRLASNSLVECAVFAKRIADAACSRSLDDEFQAKTKEIIDAYSFASPQEEATWKETVAKPLLSELRMLMMRNVGIIRHHDQLSAAISWIEEQMLLIAPHRSQFLSANVMYMRLRVAWLIARSALERCESRGGHYRSDYPETLSDDLAYRTEINKCGISKILLHNEQS